MKKIFLLFIFFVATTLSCSSKEIFKVYLDEAIEVAIKNNIDLQAAQIDINIAKNEISAANRLQNPSIDTYYFMGRAGNSEPKQIGLTQNIEIAKRNARKKLAESQMSLVKKNVEYTTFDLKMDVREAYINLVAIKSVLNTLEQQQELQEELYELAKNRAQKKETPIIDVLQAEIALNQIITQVNTARANVKVAQNAFNKIINADVNVIYDSKDNLFAEENNFQEMLTPDPTTKFPDISDIIPKVLKKRYDIQIAKQEIDIAQKNLAVVSRQRIPDFTISGGYAYQNEKYSNSGHFANGAYAGASLINIPLFYSYYPEIQKATSQVTQAELKYKSAKNKAIKDISAAYEQFLTAANNLNHYESKIIVSSEKLIDLSKNSYEKGETDITALIVMKQSYKSIIVGYTYALTDYYNSWTNFLREINDESFVLAELL